jgi:hypothetical protein
VLSGNTFLTGTAPPLSASSASKHHSKGHGKALAQAHAKARRAGHPHPTGPKHNFKKAVHHSAKK